MTAIVLVMSVSAYDDTSGVFPFGVTASMTSTRDGIVACSLRHDYGTIFYIPALKRWYVCEDRGGLIAEGFLDIWMAQYDDAIEFGRQELVVIATNPERVRGLKAMFRKYGKHYKRTDKRRGNEKVRIRHCYQRSDEWVCGHNWV